MENKGFFEVLLNRYVFSVCQNLICSSSRSMFHRDSPIFGSNLGLLVGFVMLSISLFDLVIMDKRWLEWFGLLHLKEFARNLIDLAGGHP